MKAVIWTDVFQAFVIICGMFAIVVQVSQMLAKCWPLYFKRIGCHVVLTYNDLAQEWARDVVSVAAMLS